MMTPAPHSSTLPGVLAPVVTPFTSTFKPDAERMVAHCRWLQSQGCGLAVFGTNSEGNSMTVDEKIALLDHLLDAGIDPGVLMPGTGACALPDAVRLSAHATRRGCGGVLLLPPFFYKGVSDEGLFRAVAEVIEGVGDDRLRVYLYHIPPVAQVGFSLPLIERLVAAYPGVVVGMKDSSGDWENTEAVLKALPGWGVYAGSEKILLKTMRAGGVGCISATCNVNPGPIVQLQQTWQGDDADAQQDRCNALRAVFEGYPLIPAMKWAIAHYGGDAAWQTLRPPLVELSADQGAALVRDLDRHGFVMPGLATVV